MEYIQGLCVNVMSVSVSCEFIKSQIVPCIVVYVYSYSRLSRVVKSHRKLSVERVRSRVSVTVCWRVESWDDEDDDEADDDDDVDWGV